MATVDTVEKQHKARDEAELERRKKIQQMHEERVKFEKLR